MHSTEQTALLVALLFRRSGRTRARISRRTMRGLSGRDRVSGHFTSQLAGALSAWGVEMIDLDQKGFGLLKSSALDGVAPIKAQRLIADELRQLQTGDLTFDDIRDELLPESNDSEDEF